MSQPTESSGPRNPAVPGAASAEGRRSQELLGAVKHEDRRSLQGPEVKWQVRLLPLMGGMLVALTAFFFLASFAQLYYLQTRIERSPQLDLAPAMAMSAGLEADLGRAAGFDKVRFDSGLDYIRWKTLLLLEANALQHRYHQAGVLLISRIWTRYLGFVTGMILALVGAVFILGKLRESSSQLGAESTLWKVSLTTASPGLILALLGTILMIATLATRLEIQINDGPVFLPQQYAATSEAPPQVLDSQHSTKSPTDTDILKGMKNETAKKQP